MHFELQATCPTTGARAGLLHTAHGTVETPVFMPVGTQASIKGVLPKTVEHELDAKIKEMLDVKRPVLFDCVVDQEENCFPMIPSGAAHNEMILGDAATDPAVSEAGKVLV